MSGPPTNAPGQRDEEHEDDRFHVVAASSGLELSRVLKHDETFLVAGRSGEIGPGTRREQGLYHAGTKYVSRLLWRLGRRRLLLLSSSVIQSNLQLVVDLTNPDLYEDAGEQHLRVAHGTVHVARRAFLQAGTYLERIVVCNYGASSVALELRLEFDADFADVFEVRGTRRAKRGERLESEVAPGVATLGYRGLDDVVRRTRFELNPAPTQLTDEAATYDLHLEPRQCRTFYVRIECEEAPASRSRPLPAPDPRPFEITLARARAVDRERAQQQCRVRTTNEQLNAWIQRSQADLRMLVTQTNHGPYPYAGLPWYSTAFGRDGLWVAIQTLWVDPTIASGVLRYLSALQATRTDAGADAEPGKILHETRTGEMATLEEIPFGCYFGSIDSTPLYLMLAWRYHEATGDRALIEEIWPNLLAAMQWIDVYGDRDGDGFVEYCRRSPDGLVQQGWKDSNDSVFHRSGALANGPIALCEVQGYVYDARKGLARLATMMGHHELARRWDARAERLREQFDAMFWCEDIRTYALALDGDKRACRVKSSNPGHCLFTGIASAERHAALAASLMSEELFSGFGIRTLAADEQRYNPMSYHNGSIWPHDTAVAADGLARVGSTQASSRLLGGLLDASRSMPLHRLPELFCGFERQPGQPPTRYPVACSPQAWAAGAVFMLLGAVLGLRIDGQRRRIELHRPSLPPSVDELFVENLRVGPEIVDLHLYRHPEDVGLVVTRTTGRVQVVATICPP